MKSDTYIDDFISNVDSIKNDARLAMAVVTIHRRGGFEMCGWTTNESAVAVMLPNELLSDVVVRDVNLSKDSECRTLGLTKKSSRDELKFNSSLYNETHAPRIKREKLKTCVFITRWEYRRQS